MFLHFTIFSIYSISQGLKISSFSFSFLKFDCCTKNQCSPGYNVGSSRGAEGRREVSEISPPSSMGFHVTFLGLLQGCGIYTLQICGLHVFF